MKLFERIKEAITVKQAAERYGLQPGRNGMCRCPFHSEKTPSMRINETYYYCFGCQASGDVIDLTAGLFSLTPGEAAKKLAADFGIDPDPETIVTSATRRLPKDPEEDVRHCTRVMIEYERLLKERCKVYSPKNPDEEWDPRFGKACMKLPRVSAVINDLFSSDPEERMETAAWLTKDGTITRIEEFMNKRKEQEEVNAIDEKREDAA